MATVIKAWGVLSHPRFKKARLTTWGNGFQFQYPIFATRTEAAAWRDEDAFQRGKLTRVEIRIVEAKKK